MDLTCLTCCKVRSQGSAASSLLNLREAVLERTGRVLGLVVATGDGNPDGVSTMTIGSNGNERDLSSSSLFSTSSATDVLNILLLLILHLVDFLVLLTLCIIQLTTRSQPWGPCIFASHPPNSIILFSP